MYLYNLFLNLFLSFLWHCILLGRLLKILTLEYETPFWTHDKLKLGKYKLFLFLVSEPCTYALVRKSFWLSTMNSIKDYIYWHAMGKILSFLNKLLLEDLGPTRDITLTTLFCSLNTWCTCVMGLEDLLLGHIEACCSP